MKKGGLNKPAFPSGRNGTQQPEKLYCFTVLTVEPTDEKRADKLVPKV